MQILGAKLKEWMLNPIISGNATQVPGSGITYLHYVHTSTEIHTTTEVYD